jgi:fructoselysine-6-P-deglycase FrlB-like protein
MDPEGYLADIERTPTTLAELGSTIGAGKLPLADVPSARSVLMLGMGSSAYAAGAAAVRLRAAGLPAVADLATTAMLPAPGPDVLVVAVSATGSSTETVAAAGRYAGTGRLVAVTERPGSPLAELADVVIPLLAGPEPGGVSCRSYRHTVAVLLALADRLAPGCAPDVAGACQRAADATARLLAARSDWLPQVAELLRGPSGCWVAAPAERFASAQQSSLMLREGPRVPAVACETGDWSHVDVYLTTTLDYRLLLLTGSRYEPQLLSWTSERASTVVSVGAAVDGGRAAVTYNGAADDVVALLTETTVAELVAHTWWTAT